MTEPAEPIQDEPKSDALISAFFPLRCAELIATVRERAAAVLGSRDPEAVHQLRVSLRRLRSAMRVGRRLYPKFQVRAAEEGVRELADLTNPLRDLHVQDVILREAQLAGLEPWLKARAAHERALRRKIRLNLKAGQWERSLALHEALLALPVRPRRDEAARKFGRRAIERHREQLLSMLGDIEALPEDPAAAHQVRLHAKRLRYVIEFYEPVLGDKFKKLEKRARETQTELGDLHDLDVLCEEIKTLTVMEREPRALLAEWLATRRANQAERARTALRSLAE